MMSEDIMMDPIQEGSEKKQDEYPIYKATSQMSLEAYLQMNQDLNGDMFRRIQLILMAFLLICGSLLMVEKVQGLGMLVIFIALMTTPLMNMVFHSSLRKAYERESAHKDLEMQYFFYKDTFKVRDSRSTHTYRYEDLYNVTEGADCFYLSLGPREAFRVDIYTATEGLDEFLRALGNTQQREVGWRLCGGMGLTAAFLATMTSMIISFRPDDDILKSWIKVPFNIAVVLGCISLLLLFSLWNIYPIARIKERGRRVSLRVFTILFGILLISSVFLGGFAYNWNPNLGGSKVKENADGTYTVNYDAVVGSKEQRLYEDDGSFYLHYVGPAKSK